MTALIHQSLNFSVESIKNLMHQIAGEPFFTPHIQYLPTQGINVHIRIAVYS